MHVHQNRLSEAMATLVRQLEELCAQHVALSDPAMVQLSRQLDTLINEWYSTADEGPIAHPPEGGGE